MMVALEGRTGADRTRMHECQLESIYGFLQGYKAEKPTQYTQNQGKNGCR